MIPDPRFGVDRLSDRPDQSQGRELVLRRPLLAPAHERADRGRRGIDNVRAVLVHNRPEAPAVGEVGRAFVHHGRRAVRQRAIDNVRVARHPADVGRAPIHIVFLDVEDVAVRRAGAHQIAARGVHHALGLARRAACIQDEQHVLGVHRLRRALIRSVGDEFVPPEVAHGRHGNRRRLPDAIEHDDSFDARRVF